MAKSHCSTVFECPADRVWNVIRDFNNYPVWVDGAGTSEIENGKSGDAVGAVRNVLYKGGQRGRNCWRCRISSACKPIASKALRRCRCGIVRPPSV